MPDFAGATDAILGRFKSQWAILHASDCPIAWPGMEFDPEGDFGSGGVAWVRISVLGGEAQQASLQAAPYRRFRVTGVTIVQVFAPSGSGLGTAAALEVADDVAVALEGVTVGGVVLRAASINPVGRDGAWFQVNVQVPFQFDRTA